MTTEPPKFVHDTWRIEEVNAAACQLFRCERNALIDLAMLDLLVSAEFRELSRLRMIVLRDQKMPHEMPFDFIRCDGTRFRAIVRTRILFDGLFETSLIYECEV
jgi:PAS domain S-box-containing protein